MTEENQIVQPQLLPPPLNDRVRGKLDLMFKNVNNTVGDVYDLLATDDGNNLVVNKQIQALQQAAKEDAKLIKILTKKLEEFGVDVAELTTEPEQT